MRQGEEFFGDADLRLVYIAKKLKEAQRVEDLLTAAGLEYMVEPDEYVGGFLFRSKLVGAFFYVPVLMLPQTRDTLRGAGLRPYEPEEE